jgi:RsiW-degrading membrane proteinase PrsW (M82 family)
MFFWLISPILTYRWLLIAAAVLPAIFLLVKVYRSDRIEKETPYLIWRLVLGGVISTFFALVSERLFGTLLSSLVPKASKAYNVLLYFGVVAISEELSKFVLLKKRTWRNPEFNCLFDGVVYATAVSLGFALWENISYVTMYGFTTALVRAVTAVPGHACFGVFMGVFYSLAKSNDYMGNKERSSFFNVLAVVVPVLLHGAYDYIASMEVQDFSWTFIIFVLALFAVAFLLVNRMSKNDHYLSRPWRQYR